VVVVATIVAPDTSFDVRNGRRVCYTAPMRARVLVSVVVLVAAAAVACTGCSFSKLVMQSMTPTTAFTAADTPAPPDYRDDAVWLALPSRVDEADVALAAAPAATDPAVDVFYVHSTSSIAPRFNAAVNDPEVRAASIRGGTLIQASAFNAAGAVYAPEYRQATGAAFVNPSVDGDRAIDVAFTDVAAAFAEFRRRTQGRPFIIAAHSQGAVLSARLVREVVASSSERGLLVAAYLVGAPLVLEDLGGVPLCTTPTSTGCVVTFNARGAEHVDVGVDFAALKRPGLLCTNPTAASTTTTFVQREYHGGAVFFDAPTPALLPMFVASRCRDDGILEVTNMSSLPDRGVMDAVLVRVMGGHNFHPVEYQLFYTDLRADAVRRSRVHVAFLDAK
jgi:hypothetical protein